MSGLTITTASNTDGRVGTARPKLYDRRCAVGLAFATCGSASSRWRKTRISASREAHTSNTARNTSGLRISNEDIGLCSNTLAELRHKDEALRRDRALSMSKRSSSHGSSALQTILQRASRPQSPRDEERASPSCFRQPAEDPDTRAEEGCQALVAANRSNDSPASPRRTRQSPQDSVG